MRAPQDKARVERSIGHTRDDCFAGEKLQTIQEARDHVRTSCLSDYGLRRHTRTLRMPREHFEAEEKRLLLLVLSDEASRRDGQAATIRAQRARLEPTMSLERWDTSARVSYDKVLLNELVSLRFIEKRAHLTIVGPVGVGKTLLAHAIGHIACHRGYSVLAVRADPGRTGRPGPPLSTEANMT